MPQGKAVIGQSGGPTAVINKSLVGFIKEATNLDFAEILGAKHGLEGMLNEDFVDLSNLSEAQLYGIGKTPAAALGSVRKKPTDSDIEKLVSIFEKENIRNFFYIGGNDSAETANLVSEGAKSIGYDMKAFHIPKTIDNDIPYCVKTFGFETAFSKAVEAVQAAHSEAYGRNYGVVIIKLMGRNSGFIAANTSLACPDVNFVLIPEVPFTIQGEKGLLRLLERRFENKKKQSRHPHSVIVVAEGAGQDLLGNNGEERDASGNIRFKDIGFFLKENIQKYFKDRYPVNIKLIEPSYMIRSLPANPHDAIFCYYLADHAVHAAMAGKTDMMVGYWNGHFTHVPLEIVNKNQKRIDPHGEFWRQVLFSTGQAGDLYSHK